MWHSLSIFFVLCCVSFSIPRNSHRRHCHITIMISFTTKRKACSYKQSYHLYAEILNGPPNIISRQGGRSLLMYHVHTPLTPRFPSPFSPLSHANKPPPLSSPPPAPTAAFVLPKTFPHNSRTHPHTRCSRKEGAPGLSTHQAFCSGAIERHISYIIEKGTPHSTLKSMDGPITYAQRVL